MKSLRGSSFLCYEFVDGKSVHCRCHLVGPVVKFSLEKVGSGGRRGAGMAVEELI